MARVLARAPAAAGHRTVVGDLHRRWQGLASRERGMLLLMVFAIVGAGLWVGWWEPLQKQRQHLQGELPRLRAQQQELERLLERQQRQRRDAVLTASVLNAQLHAVGLDKQITLSETKTQWRLVVRDAPADALWNWLLPVLADPAVPLQELTLERTGDPNMAAARVSGTIVMGHKAGDGGAR